MGGIVYFIAHNFDGESFFKILSEMSVTGFFLCVFAQLIGLVFFCLRFQRICRIGPKICLSFPIVWRYCHIALFFSQWLPTSMGGEFYRGYALKKKGLKMADVVSTLFTDRFMGLISMWALCLFFIPFEWATLTQHSMGWLIMACGLALTLGTIILCKLYVLKDSFPYASPLWQHLFDFSQKIHHIFVQKKDSSISHPNNIKSRFFA